MINVSKAQNEPHEKVISARITLEDYRTLCDMALELQTTPSNLARAGIGFICEEYRKEEERKKRLKKYEKEWKCVF